MVDKKSPDNLLLQTVVINLFHGIDISYMEVVGQLLVAKLSVPLSSNSLLIRIFYDRLQILLRAD
jgi:hypothetical protein